MIEEKTSIVSIPSPRKPASGRVVRCEREQPSEVSIPSPRKPASGPYGDPIGRHGGKVSIPSPRKPASGPKSRRVSSSPSQAFQSPRRGNPRPDCLRPLRQSRVALRFNPLAEETRVRTDGPAERRIQGQGFNPLAEETRVRTFSIHLRSFLSGKFQSPRRGNPRPDINMTTEKKNKKAYVSIPSPRKPASGRRRSAPSSAAPGRFNPLAEETRVRTVSTYQRRQRREMFQSPRRGNPRPDEWSEAWEWVPGEVSIPSPRKPASGQELSKMYGRSYFVSIPSPRKPASGRRHRPDHRGRGEVSIPSPRKPASGQ